MFVCRYLGKYLAINSVVARSGSSSPGELHGLAFVLKSHEPHQSVTLFGLSWAVMDV